MWGVAVCVNGAAKKQSSLLPWLAWAGLWVFDHRIRPSKRMVALDVPAWPQHGRSVAVVKVTVHIRQSAHHSTGGVHCAVNAVHIAGARRRRYVAFAEMCPRILSVYWHNSLYVGTLPGAGHLSTHAVVVQRCRKAAQLS